jgi:hypothetical protein
MLTGEQQHTEPAAVPTHALRAMSLRATSGTTEYRSQYGTADISGSLVQHHQETEVSQHLWSSFAAFDFAR